MTGVNSTMKPNKESVTVETGKNLATTKGDTNSDPGLGALQERGCSLC